MKRSHRRPIAVLLAAAVSLGAFGGWFTASAADTEDKKEVRLVFQIDEDAEPSKTTDVSLFETTTTTDGHTNIPVGTFFKKGYIFAGWTYDDVVGFSSGQFVDIPDDADELVFHICWVDSTQDKHTVKYVLERDGITFDNPEWLEEESYYPNEVFNPNDTTVFVEKETEEGTLKYVSKWLTDGERVFSYGTQLVMPDHDITLYPILYKKIQLTYFAGDVDRLNGNDTYSFEKTEGTSDELANAERFSRSGFELVGWTSSFDGKQYKPSQTVLMPGEDVVYTAVWQPIDYKVVFNPGNGGTSIKVPATTDEVITCPDPGITVEGKHFAGWKSTADGTIYQAGDEYKVLGAMPGMGISFKAVWEDGDAPEGTTSASTTAATTATTSVTTVETFVPEDIICGDANCDKKVSVADSVAILQHIGNLDKYGLSALGKVNGDVDGEAGITANDALTIQQLDAKLITKFPVE
ncbi:MAG: InlB B-repeat-containing protein [Ruminococcus sp.]|nr:InlB B-repeat-containing protein [Ruminococcus sp.]